ncbi:fumarylacetoacetate hydrolase family protein [Sphingomonas sp. C3-2]|uniref:fumarylacetoacetate hydrolase family protein n=1 Tax=Sphingomonas sp. C3-2 TaxID=3062169 RepID=UPI00294B23F4|nr:fumarylacetoacetate hydrolase family protein [Sphingomonas sp. C3-2]WOK35437.1 fumarylacetoacetate hydrolase family protein [Sphingomonas sp. C3-2]
MSIEPPIQPLLPILGGGRFPVGRIFCVARNYAEHAREMGDVSAEPPFFFIKPSTCLPTVPGRLPYPPMSEDVHHEVELVVALGLGGADIAPADALRHVFGYAVGLDMTRRDLQAEAKEKRRPWDMGKVFDGAAPVSVIVPAAEAEGLDDAEIQLTIDGEVRQQGRTSDMIWSPAEIIAELSRYIRLNPGDLIFTGTPAGVGPVVRGNRLEARVGLLPSLEVEIV